MRRNQAAALIAAVGLLLGACAPATTVGTSVGTTMETTVVHVPGERTCVPEHFQVEPDRVLVGIMRGDGLLHVVITLVGPPAYAAAGEANAYLELHLPDGRVHLPEDAFGFGSATDDATHDTVSFPVDRDMVIDLLNAGGDVRFVLSGQNGRAEAAITAETWGALRAPFGIECLPARVVGNSVGLAVAGEPVADNPATGDHVADAQPAGDTRPKDDGDAETGGATAEEAPTEEPASEK